MTKEKEETAPAPRSWWEELFEQIRTAKPDARYRADKPAPIVAPEPLPPEPEPEGERSTSAEFLYAYTQAMQRGSVMGRSHKFDWRPLMRYRTNWNAYRPTVKDPLPELPPLPEFDGTSEYIKR